MFKNWFASYRWASHHLEEVKEATIAIELHEINKMHIENLPNLRSFSSGDIVGWPSLENMVVNHCPNLKKFGMGKDDEFSTITEYNVGDDEELGKAIKHLRPSHFTNLLLFRAKNCNQILNLNEFLSILVKRSNKLETISIERCETVGYLFDVSVLTPDKDGDGKYFTQLKELKLIEVYLLDLVWNGDPAGIFGLGNLQIIHIKSCRRLDYLISAPSAEKLHQLKELKLEDCDMNDKVVIQENDNIKTIKFLALSKVEFKSLSDLKQFYKRHLEFPNLKTLMIENCPRLEKFTTGFAIADASSTTDGKSFSELNELKLDSCHSLVVVVSSETLQELRNLKKLIVSHCNALKKVFNIQSQTSHSTELPKQLDELILTDPPKLTHIINRETARFSIEATFSQLKDVSLENLINLFAAFPSSSEFPSLETLKIANCPALMTFVEESNELKDPPESATSNYFFPNSMSLNKLKVLYVINQDVEKLWHYNCPSESFCELENLTLSNNNKLLSVISSSMIIRFNNLKKLTLDNCELLTEVFNLEDDKLDHNIQEMLPQLRALALSNLSNLTCVWNKEPQVPFLPNLVSLVIVRCGSLKSLFSLSSAKNLGKLKSLKLCKCEKIEVISSDKDENVIFPEMECLILKDLPKLVSFSRQSGTFDWPNLQTVRVSNTPSMKTFSIGNLSTPLLRSVYITFAKRLWLGNLNNTISYMHDNPGTELQEGRKEMKATK
ncbi:Disease resistance protein RPS2 [Spatholobus suberectus]|nr:Disease resistance protein RPS2 [Spatholobus suberectus]